MMWTKTAVRAHQAALAAATKHKEAIDRLREMSKHMPAFAEQIEALAAMRDNLEALSRIAVAVDPSGE